MHRFRAGSLQVDQVSVAIADLPNDLVGTQIVQLSDFHYDGLRLGDDLLEEAIAATNAADPDLIVLTGDYVTDDPEPIWQLAWYLKQFRSRAGVYAVLGNHDRYHPKAQTIITQALTSVDITVLWNEVAYPLHPRFPLVGLADFWSRQFQPELVLDALDPDLPRLVLSHNPDSAVPLKKWRVDLQLSGHTHGGQVVIPGLGPVPALYDHWRDRIPPEVRAKLPWMKSSYLRVVQHWEWSEGLHRVGQNQLYVNRGLGTYFPGRLNCPPEVTVMTLNAAAPKA